MNRASSRQKQKQRNRRFLLLALFGVIFMNAAQSVHLLFEEEPQGENELALKIIRTSIAEAQIPPQAEEVTAPQDTLALAIALESAKKVSFLAGLISMYRPNISDCGLVAKEIVEVSQEEGFDPFFIASLISVESSFATHAKSNKGALGLMQLLPNTAKEVSEQKTGKKHYPRLTHPRTNIELGVEYLKRLETRYKGNRFQALAAYNWGPGNLNRSIRKGGSIPKSVQNYAIKILERTHQWKSHYKKANKTLQTLA